MRIDRQKEKDKYISKGTAINSGASPEGSFMLFSDLTFFFFFCYAAWHVGSQFSHQGLNPHPLQWKCGVLTTGLPGKSWSHLLNSSPQCWVVFACMNAHAYTPYVISFCEPSSTAAATEASEWWQLIMKHYAWCVPFISSCRSLAFPRNSPVDLCNPGKEVSIWKQLLLR